MVKSWVCPRCLGDLDTFYIEEGDVIVASDRVVCPSCGFTLEGSVDECEREAEPGEHSQDVRGSRHQGDA